MSDRLSAASDGEKEALDSLAKEQCAWMIAMARLRLNNHPWCSPEDAVQDVLGRLKDLLSRLKENPTEQDLKNLLAKALRDRVVEVHRRAEMAMNRLGDEVFDQQPSSAGLPSHGARVKETIACLTECLAELDEEKRSLLRLHFIEGLSRPQIAQMTGQSEATIRGRLDSAMKLMREGMGRRSEHSF